MSNQWFRGPAPQQQQWNTQLPTGSIPAQHNQTPGWSQGSSSQWQPMQQASLQHQQLHQQSFQGQQFPVRQQPISGQSQGQPHGGGFHGYPQGNPQPQQPMSQQAYIQEQQRLAKEEQRLREVEIQKRKLATMNVAGAKKTSSIDNLIGLTNIGDLSPATKKKPNPLKTTPSNSPSMPTKQTQPLSKGRSWTMDTSNLQGVFTQQDDNFGEFQSGAPIPPQPKLQPQYVSGVGVIPTSSYTHPIPATSVSQVTTQGGVTVGEQRTRSMSSPYSRSRQPHTTNQPTSLAAPSPGRSGILNPSTFPAVYMQVYSRCLDNDGTTLSTELLFPVLMSSKLPKSLLGELWQVANRGTPGRLSQTELFVLLGLIALAQGGNPKPKFEDLQKAPAPPVPVLDALTAQIPLPTVTAVLPKAPIQPLTSEPQVDDFGNFQQGQSTTSISLFSTSNPTSVLSLTATSIGPPTTLTPHVPVTSAPLSTSDEYGAFNELRTDKVEQPPSVSDDFGSFVSKSVSPAKKNEQFGDFSASIVPTSSDSLGWADFSSAQPVSSTILPSTTASSGLNIPALSDLGSLLPTEGQLKAAPFSTQHTNSQSSNLPVQGPEVASSTQPKESAALGRTFSMDIFEQKPVEAKTKKQLTGLDILNEEMSARLLSSEANEQSSRQLDDKPLVPESLDEFGDFETFSGTKVNNRVSSQGDKSVTENKAPTVTFDPCKVWRTCLVKCSEVLEKCVSVFGVVEEKTVLEEIAQSEEGRNRLRGIAEVYRLAKRVYSSLRDREPVTESDDYTRDIKRHWNSLLSLLPDNVMKQLYSECQLTTDNNADTSDVLSDTISKCSLCLMGKSVSISAGLSLDGKQEEYPLPLLFHKGQSYHASCVNFWSNVMQERLPNLN